MEVLKRYVNKYLENREIRKVIKGAHVLQIGRLYRNYAIPATLESKRGGGYDHNSYDIPLHPLENRQDKMDRNHFYSIYTPL